MRGNGNRPGLGAVAAMACVVVLAKGITGTGDAAPSGQYVDDVLRSQLRADQVLYPITDAGELLRPPGVVPRPQKVGTKPRPSAGESFVRDYRKIAYRIAREEGLRLPQIFVRQMAAESGLLPCRRSGAGAQGIAQIMPATARSWGVDPHMPEQALRAAARVMKRYHAQYGDIRKALAAYNAGPGAVNEYGGVPPFDETRTYVRRIMDRSYPLPGMQTVFKLPGGYSTRFNAALKALMADITKRGGYIRIESGHRSYDDQVRLWVAAKRQYGSWQAASTWVAPPGCSNHNLGWAADLAGDLSLAHQLAGKHGLVFPMAHEPWHVELAGR